MFNTFIYEPLYNGLIFLTSVVPGNDAGVAVVILTVIVKIILFPLYQKSLRSQMVMREIEPGVKKIQEENKGNREEIARRTLALYKENNISPFTSILLLFIQIPILFALYFVFYKGLLLHTGGLYSFVSYPDHISDSFLSLFSITEKHNVIMALLVGVSQFVQAKLTLPKENKEAKKTGSFQEEFAKSMRLQVLYILPLFIVFVSYSFPAVLSLYWTTSNLFSIGQEIYLRKKLKHN